METALYILPAMVTGLIIGWLIAKNRFAATAQAIKEEAQQQYTALEKELVTLQVSGESKLQAANNELANRHNDFNTLKNDFASVNAALDHCRQQYPSTKAGYDTTSQNLAEKNNDFLRTRAKLEALQQEQSGLQQELATTRAANQALEEKLQTQKSEIEEVGKKFNIEFENIANKILETKTGTFTELNKANMKSLLEPLGENIQEFKKQVQEAYGKESKERFSLQNEVKSLMQLNHQLSKEAPVLDHG